MRNKHAFPVIIALAILAGLGCGNDPTGPEIEGGAGLTLTLPPAAQGLDWLRVELWVENGVERPLCNALRTCVRQPELLGGGDDPPFDTCSRMKVQIWSLDGKRVRFEEDVACCQDGKLLSYGWDITDDAGNPMPSGYYPMRADCLDSVNPFYLDPAGYIVAREREDGIPGWPVWTRELAGDEIASQLAYGPFKTAFSTILINQFTGEETLVPFTSPFILRVHAPGMETFVQEVELIRTHITRVPVTLTPVEMNDDETQDP